MSKREKNHEFSPLAMTSNAVGERSFSTCYAKPLQARDTSINSQLLATWLKVSVNLRISALRRDFP